MYSWTRRKFLQTAGGASLMRAGGKTLGAIPLHPASETLDVQWYSRAWRRAVIDMHIPDWDERFLSEFDARQYAEMLVRSRAQSIVCCCLSHTGLFNYPTKVGKQHAAWKGRNALQEMIDRCHERKISVVLYCSLIFDRWAGDTYPEWRIRNWEGKIYGQDGRQATICPNSPYRDYVRRFVTEISDQFDFEGIRFDMTFWPAVCYCEYCQKRFAEEVGGTLPMTVDWQDEKWVAFQRCRERWLIEFARVPTETVLSRKPKVSIEHQSSTYPLNWTFGVTEGLAGQNSFLQGDFYGDQLLGSFVRKLLERMTPNRPFGYETSFSIDLHDHTAMKSEELLLAKASAAIADSAAFIFIDAINPIGTVNLRTHARMGKVFDRLMPYYPHIGGERLFDVAIYYSLESKFTMASGGRHIGSTDSSDAHTESAMQVASRLIQAHLPFEVITKASLSQLQHCRILILPNVNMMDENECETIRGWVQAGGGLIATGGTSIVDKLGRKHSDFMLADVFGVSLVEANWSNRNHYIAPTSDGQDLFPEFDTRAPVYSQGFGIRVNAAPNTTVLATTTLPWPSPDPTKFSSVYSDPPWMATDYPEVTLNHFGKGAAVYCGTRIETLQPIPDTIALLVRRLNSRFCFEVDAPACVEATLFHQPDRRRHVLSLVNFQKELPNLPVEGIVCRLDLDVRINEIQEIPSMRGVDFIRRGAMVEFRIPRLETLAQFAAQHG